MRETSEVLGVGRESWALGSKPAVVSQNWWWLIHPWDGASCHRHSKRYLGQQDNVCILGPIGQVTGTVLGCAVVVRGLSCPFSL